MFIFNKLRNIYTGLFDIETVNFNFFGSLYTFSKVSFWERDQKPGLIILKHVVEKHKNNNINSNTTLILYIQHTRENRLDKL